MPIPDYQSLMRPLLAFGSDGSEKNISDAINGIANQLGLTEDERHQLLPSGKQAIFANRVHWARTYLDRRQVKPSNDRARFVLRTFDLVTFDGLTLRLPCPTAKQ